MSSFVKNKTFGGAKRLSTSKPLFFMMVGLPYSGKSEYAKRLSAKYDAAIHSSDNIREELTGDAENQDNNEEVFKILTERIKNDLASGKNVVYDATNLGYKRRIDFLMRLNKIKCKKICIFMATPFDVCIERSKHRDRVVPYDVLVRMYKTIWTPYKYEGWDKIKLVYPEEFETRSIKELFNADDGLNYISQDNPHHTMSVGHHCVTTYGLVDAASKEVQEAALLHDIGKPFTKSFTNYKGEPTEIAHYYHHQHVSAYDSLFYTSPSLDRLYVSVLIQWHMWPFVLDKTTKPLEVTDKFKRLVGKQIYDDVMLIHEADIKAK